MVDGIDLRASGIVLPGSAQYDAMLLGREMDSMRYELERGTGDPARARELVRQARAIAMHLGPGDQVPLLEKAERLQRIADRADPPQPEPQPRLEPRARANAEAEARREFGHTLRRLPDDPHLARAAVRDATLRSMHGLARMTTADLDRLIDRSDLTGEQAELVRETIRRTLGTAFHRRVVETATDAIGNLRNRLERSQRGAGFEQVAEQMWGPQRMPTLRGLERCGARAEVEELERLLDRVDIDPSRRHELAPQIREALRRALAAAEEGVARLHDRMRGGDFAYDHDGRAYALFPKAIERTAVRMGVAGARAEGLARGQARGASVFEDAVASDVAERREIRNRAEAFGQATFIVAGIVSSVLSGGSTAAMLVGIGLNGVEVSGAYEHADQMGVAAASDLATGEAADEARQEAHIGLATAVVSAAIGAAGKGATHGARHAAHRVAEEVVHAVVEEAPNIVNAARHEAHRRHAREGGGR